MMLLMSLNILYKISLCWKATGNFNIVATLVVLK